MNNKIFGALGERAAENYLKRQGARIVGRNVRYSVGEIDLIARMDGFLCFVEVKSRTSDAYGRPAAAVDKGKQRRIIMAAYCYLKQHHLREERVRFDVAEVTLTGVRYIPGAFEGKNL